MQSETNSVGEPNGLEADPAKALALKKLALEIADLERPWWKRPAYVLAALPTMLAFATLLAGVFSGYFQAAYTKLENQKRDLEAQVKVVEEKRNELDLEYQKTRQELESTKEQLAKIEKEMVAADDKVALLAKFLGVETNQLRLALGSANWKTTHTTTQEYSATQK